MNNHSNISLSRVEKRRKDALERVLETATMLFSRQGFFETSIAEIAQAADVSVGTVYNLVESKEALYRTLVHKKTLIFHQRLKLAMERGGSPRDRIERVLVEKLELFRDEAAAIHMYFTINAAARVSPSTGFPLAAKEVYDQGLNMLAAVIEEGTRGGYFAAVDSLRAATAVQAATTEIYLLHLEDPHAHPREAVLGDVLRLVFKGLLGPNNRPGLADQTAGEED